MALEPGPVPRVAGPWVRPWQVAIVKLQATIYPVIQSIAVGPTVK